jgi:hypothetical protein
VGDFCVGSDHFPMDSNGSITPDRIKNRDGSSRDESSAQDQVAELSKGIEIDPGAAVPDQGCVGTLTELATNAAPATSTATKLNTRTDATTAGGHLVQARSD